MPSAKSSVLALLGAFAIVLGTAGTAVAAPVSSGTSTVAETDNNNWD